ncbi:hypothetical protein JCM10207_000453 [Rhodosporidiobolus poonsookiae]
MSGLTDQQLLYALRSPTTPLADKLQQATSALDASPSSTSLPPLIRDWALDVLLKASRTPAAATLDPALLSVELWAVVARTTLATPSASTAVTTLPIYSALVQAYAAQPAQASVEVLRSAVEVWKRLAPGGLRKALPDAALEGYEKLVEASLSVVARCQADAEGAAELAAWEELVVVWLRAMRGMLVEGGKAGKKTTSHTLSLLPKLLPLLSTLPHDSSFRLVLLQTIQLALFNLENLRRGLARETYAAGGAPQAAVTLAESELLTALGTLPSDLTSHALAALPSFTRTYFAALASHSSALFPLPVKASFPTPSAQKSALEVLGLTKRREFAGRWVKSVIDYLAWSAGEKGDAMQVDAAAGEAEKEKAAALAAVMREVEKDDLYRQGQADEGWSGVFSSIVAGSVTRLAGAKAADAREAIVDVLAVVAQLSYDAVEAELPAVLANLAGTPFVPSSPSTSTANFLSQLVMHHSRSLSIPTLLRLVSDALASSPVSASNNLLTTHSFFQQVGQAIGGIVGGPAAARATYESLVGPVQASLAPSTAGDEEEAAGPSPTKKRKLSSDAPSPSATLSAASRLRVLALFISHVPFSALPTLVEPVKTLLHELVELHLRDFVKAAQSTASPVAADGASEAGTPSKKARKEEKKRRKSGLLPLPTGGAEAGEVDSAVRLGVELLEVRYAAVERLAREELLQSEEGEEGERWWEIKAKRREGLRELVATGAGEAAIVSARTLLQHLELVGSSASAFESEAVLQAVLGQVAADSTSSWSSFVRSVRRDEVPAAMWELVSRRWVQVFETVATDAQLKQLVDLALVPLTRPSSASELSVGGASARLLRRADFWELPRIQAHLLPTLVSLVTLTLPNFSSAASILAGADEKTLASLRSLSPSTLLGTVRLFDQIVAHVPLEYFSKTTREQLAERALALDLWVSGGEANGVDEKRGEVQRQLRSFVGFVGASNSLLAPVLPKLFSQTEAPAKAATLDLHRSFLQNAVLAYKASQSTTELVSLVKTLPDKPLSDLPKRIKKSSEYHVTAEESAPVLLLETLAKAFPDRASLPADLAEATTALAKSASKALDKALPLATAALEANGQALVSGLGDLFDVARSLWLFADCLGAEGKVDTTAFVAFTDKAVTTALAHPSSFSSTPSAAAAALSLLLLLGQRISSLRSTPSEASAATASLETFVACQLAFRRVLPASAQATADSIFARTISSASLEDYSSILAGVASFIGTVVVRPSIASAELGAALDVALILLRDGPEGSSRLATSALSELLRHLSVLVDSTASETGALETNLVAASFLDSICGEKPVLLSRLNVSNALAFVSRLLQPSATSAPVKSQPFTGTLFRTLVSIVTHLVRHRKDHAIPLFPLLVSTLASFISVLRRAGFGTTGSSVAIDEIEASVALGQRAEREAKAAFPAWVWEGGSQGIGRAEAKSVGRLLGALTAKTTSQGVKRKKDASGGADDGTSSTMSLVAPLSKHAPFLLLTYLRACVHSTCPIPSALRSEMQGGWFEVMDAMGKWEKEALMKGLLGDEEEAERGLLKALNKRWEQERYRG